MRPRQALRGVLVAAAVLHVIPVPGRSQAEGGEAACACVHGGIIVGP
jgi:hypothetical protein